MKDKINFRDPDQTLEFIKNSFADSPKRLEHILQVAECVHSSANELGLNAPLAYCAALLHDVGYLEELKVTGFHPIDGANFLSREGYPEIAALIVCHSNSPEQAHIKKLPEISISEDPIAKLITYWDVQTKQGGELVSYDQRLEDIVARYGEESDVTRAHRMAEPRIRKIIKEFSSSLDKAAKHSTTASNT